MVDEGKFRRILLGEKNRLARSIDALGEKGLDRSLGESISEMALYDNHPADIGSETFEREKDFGLREDQRTTMDMVEKALGRLDVGTYGTCQRCGKTIPTERLEAVPWTAYCVTCEKALEDAEARDWGRPAEEGVLAPFSDVTDDDPDKRVEFDSEDAWQAVARFGTSDTPSDTPPAVDYGDTFAGASEDIGAVEDVEETPDSTFDPGRVVEEGAPPGSAGRREPKGGRNKRLRP